ncbi:hypothetical protein AAFH96_35105 [Polymorphospora sp. 2-325]|uniref:Uncharacterized protein n=1 Tax=Polymorphospora lycopeni TaxID=3140240 RepID=A0ABV5D4P6_9ACTN
MPVDRSSTRYAPVESVVAQLVEPAPLTSTLTSGSGLPERSRNRPAIEPVGSSTSSTTASWSATTVKVSAASRVRFWWANCRKPPISWNSIL